MRVLGIDFGTSNTVAMVRAADGRARPLLFDGSPLLPSAVYLNTGGRLLVGRDAERSARIDPACFEPNPKRRVDDGVVLLGDREMPVPQVIGSVLGHVAGEARRQLAGGLDEVRMTHPAQWGERRRAVLVEAARAAGMPAPRLIVEPVAAASYYTAVLGTAVPVGRALAIYDLGGGTFDATVVRRTPAGFEVLAEHGLADLGGLDFDHALVEHLGRGYSDTRTQLWHSVISPADPRQRRQRALLYDDVRGAKEMLSRTTSADVHLPTLEIDAHITREELENLIRPYLVQTITCLAQTVAAARLAPPDLVGIFLVGGSSRIPLAAHLIHTELGVAPTTLEQPETVVAEGSLYFGAAAAAPAGGHSGVPRPVAPPPRAPAHQPPVARPQVARPQVARPPVGPPAPPPAAQPPRPAPPATVAPPRMAPPPPVHQAAPPVRQGPPPRPVAPPRPPTIAPRRDRAWYEEPTVIWTVAVLVMVIVAFAVLIAAASGG
ncbi:MAG TPA: Hsp70 family protein [Pilimelia sp.]|nr:Hsp70 family protein [Pilimelia sp.]